MAVRNFCDRPVAKFATAPARQTQGKRVGRPGSYEMPSRSCRAPYGRLILLARNQGRTSQTVAWQYRVRATRDWFRVCKTCRSRQDEGTLPAEEWPDKPLKLSRETTATRNQRSTVALAAEGEIVDCFPSTKWPVLSVGSLGVAIRIVGGSFVRLLRLVQLSQLFRLL